MYKLTKKSDLEKMLESDVDPLIYGHISRYLDHMLREFNCDDIAEYGTIVYLDSFDNVKITFELELETPFSHLNPDCVAGILIQGENDFRSIVQALYNVDEKALVVFGVTEVIEPMVALQYKNNA